MSRKKPDKSDGEEPSGSGYSQCEDTVVGKNLERGKRIGRKTKVSPQSEGSSAWRGGEGGGK